MRPISAEKALFISKPAYFSFMRLGYLHSALPHTNYSNKADGKSIRVKIVVVQSSQLTTANKRRTDDEKNSALKQIIGNKIIADGVDNIFSLVGLDKPNIGLLPPNCMENVVNLTQKNWPLNT